MRLPRVRLPVRNVMLLVAIVAVFITGARHLIMGDAGVTIELSNKLSRRIRDIRIGCLPDRDEVASKWRVRIMSEPVLDPPANPIRGTSWGLMLLGLVCLGMGLWFATGGVRRRRFYECQPPE